MHTQKKYIFDSEEIKRSCQIMEVNLKFTIFRSSYSRIKHSFSPPYTLQANIIKTIRKFTIKGEVEQDEVLNTACTAYNFFPNGWSQELVFFLMFRTDVYVPTSENLLCLRCNIAEINLPFTISSDAKKGLHVGSNKSQKS